MAYNFFIAALGLTYLKMIVIANDQLCSLGTNKARFRLTPGKTPSFV